MFGSASESWVLILLLNFCPSGRYGTPLAVTCVLCGFDVEIGRDYDVFDYSRYLFAV